MPAMKMEFLICPDCRRPFGLASGTGKLISNALPEDFQAACPHCSHHNLFSKSDIKVKTMPEE